VLEAWRRTPFARILVLEHDSDHALPPATRASRVGDTVLSVYTD
jgi:hypothetical protein